MKRTASVLLALVCFCTPAFAQKTKAQLNTEIGTTYPDNANGQITASGVRSYESDVVNSIMPTAPVIAGNPACYNGTTGLLMDCAGFSLNGTINGAGNQINNVIIGNANPLPASFTNLFAINVNATAQITTPVIASNGGLNFFTSTTNTAGGITSGGQWIIDPNSGVGATGGALLTVSHNTATLPAIPGPFGSPELSLGSADGSSRTVLSMQAFATAGGEPSLLLFGARGTAASPTQSKNGDFIGEIGFHPYGLTGGYVYSGGAEIISTITEDCQATSCGQDLRIFTTPTGSATAGLSSVFNAQGGLTIGLETPVSSSRLTVSKNASATPASFSAIEPSPVVHFVGVDGANTSVVMQAFGTGVGSGTRLLSARGTQALPTATQSTDLLGSVFGYGYATSGSAGYVSNAGAGFQMVATEAYTSTAGGAKLAVLTTPNGTATFATAATFQASGGLSVGTTTDGGIGTILANKGIGTVPTTVASLPTCNAGYEGQRAYVTDQNTAVSYRGAVTGSGATRQAVLCSNSAWIQD